MPVRTRRLLLGLSLSLVVQLLQLAQPRTASAEPQQDDASRAAAAQALFEDAVKLIEAGKFGEACPKLAASEKLDPGAGTLLNLGTCYEKNHQTASAWATFIEAESVAKKAGHADWASRAREHSERLAPRLPKVVIVVPKEVVLAGLAVTRDGVVLDEGAWGTPIPLDAGPHEVTAAAPQKKPWSAHIDLEDDRPPVTVTVGPLEDLPAPPPPVEPPPKQEPLVAPPPPPPPLLSPPPGFWTTTRAVGATVGGIGIAGLASGLALVLAGASKYQDAYNHCNPTGSCARSYLDEDKDAHTLADVATAVLIGGGVFTAAGGALLLFGGPKEAAQTSGWRLAPAAGPHVAGASLGREW